jgi:aminoglycoside 3-N-acetyltransferase
VIDFDGLVTGFKKIGLTNGDVVLVHSSFKSLGEVKGGPQKVVDALVSVVGEKGTVIFPNFNFDFSRYGTTWNIKDTPSHMGIISEFARKDPRSLKVFHPIYSFSIIGKHAEKLVKNKYKGGYSKESVFNKLRILDGKIIHIDTIYKGSTFFHHVEEMVQVDYKFFKEFTGFVIDKNEKKINDTFELYVRDLDRGIVTDVTKISKILEKKEIMKNGEIGDATVWYMKAEDVFQCTEDAIKKDPHVLCKIINPTKENAHKVEFYNEILNYPTEKRIGKGIS